MVHLQLVISAFFVVVAVFQIQVDGAPTEETLGVVQDCLRTWLGSEDITVSSDGTITGISSPSQIYTVQQLKEALSTVTHESLRAVLGLNDGFESDRSTDVNFRVIFQRLIAGLGREVINYETAVIFAEAMNRVGNSQDGYSPWIFKTDIQGLKTVFYIMMRIKQCDEPRIVFELPLRDEVRSWLAEAFALFFLTIDCSSEDWDFSKHSRKVTDLIGEAALGINSEWAAEKIVTFLYRSLRPDIKALNDKDPDSKRQFLQQIICMVVAAATTVRGETGPFNGFQ